MVSRWKQLQLSPKRTTPPQFFLLFLFLLPFHILISLTHLSISLPPPSCFLLCTYPSSALPHAHYRRLTQHMCRPLCVLMCPFITGLNVKSIHWVHLMTAVPVCLCVAVLLYVVKFAVFQHLIVFVCFWVLSLLRRSFWKACVKAVKSLVPQHFCQSTRSHAQTLVLPIKPFSALFHPSATAVLGDTDRERNFRPRGNFVYVCVHGSPQEIGRGCHSRCLCPEQLTTKML